MTAEALAWLFLNRIPDLGPMRFFRLLEIAGSAENILRMSARDLQAAQVSSETAARWFIGFADSRRWRDAERDADQILRGEFRAVFAASSEYPETLRELIDRPPVLYLKGRWPIPDAAAVGIVGTRQATPYGLQAAERFASEFVDARLTVVSGLAIGVDRKAHETALRKDGYTIAALGHGLGHQYPRENVRLFEEIAEKGLLVTEFPYEVRPEAAFFPRRNRIIAGLSEGVLVIEAGEKSGALITARNAAEQGREVWVVPGSIFQGVSAGCHRLIKEGAHLVESPDEILASLGAREEPKNALVESQTPKTVINVSREEEELLKHMQDPISVEELALQFEGQVDRLATALLSLELKGIIRLLPGQRYVTNNIG